MSEPIYLTRDDGIGRWVEWHANSATHLALPADEFRAMQTSAQYVAEYLAERDALHTRLAAAEARAEAAVAALRRLLAFTDPLGVSQEPMNVEARAALTPAPTPPAPATCGTCGNYRVIPPQKSAGCPDPFHTTPPREGGKGGES